MKLNHIYHGDCLEVMKGFPDKSIDMVLCDMPYGTTSCKWDTPLDLNLLWLQYKRIIKGGGLIILTATQPFSSLLVMSNINWFKYEIIWEKERLTNIFLIKKRIGMVHENILLFYNKQPVYNPIKVNRIFKTIGIFGGVKKSRTHKNQIYKYAGGYDRNICYPRSVLKLNRDSLRYSFHPTQKPIALFQYLIKTYTNIDGVVLDNCIGSGTTAIACLNTNRNFIGIEKDEYYYRLSRLRVLKHKFNLLNMLERIK